MSRTSTADVPSGGSTPRIAPIDLADANPEQAALLEALGGQDALHLFRTLAHNPALMKSWLRFGGHLLQRGSLPERDRELVILRVAKLCGSDYEWGQHVEIARSAGLVDAEIERTGRTTVDTEWPARDETLLTATDELTVDHCISEATWANLANFYDVAQIIELTMLAGHYAMLAGALRSMGVQTESPLPLVGEV